MSPDEVADRVERQCQRIKAAEFAGTRIEHRIESALGVVVVDVWGELLQVRLDPVGVRVADSSTVDKRILCAIQAAEQRAAQLIDDYLHRPAKQR